MRNKDIFTIQRHLFIKSVPAYERLRIRIHAHYLIDIGSAIGLLALVVLALAW